MVDSIEQLERIVNSRKAKPGEKIQAIKAIEQITERRKGIVSGSLIELDRDQLQHAITRTEQLIHGK